MTTKVTVHAAHGLDVDVTPISTATRMEYSTVRVKSGQTGDFYVHSGQDLLIHEVQPAEAAAETNLSMLAL